MLRILSTLEQNRREEKTNLDTVNVRLDVAGLVQIENVHRPEERTPLRERCGPDPTYDLLAR